MVVSAHEAVPWTANDPEQTKEARNLDVWPLDEHNAALLNEVHPRGYKSSTEEPLVRDNISCDAYRVPVLVKTQLSLLATGSLRLDCTWSWSWWLGIVQAIGSSRS